MVRILYIYLNILKPGIHVPIRTVFVTLTSHETSKTKIHVLPFLFKSGSDDNTPIL
mgnify:CR=1 FL=1